MSKKIFAGIIGGLIGFFVGVIGGGFNSNYHLDAQTLFSFYAFTDIIGHDFSCTT